MIGIKKEDVLELPGIICFEGLLLRDGDLFLFDKINADEGRLCRYDRDLKRVSIVKELDEGECFFGRDGFLYMLASSDESVIEKYDLNGEKAGAGRFGSKIYSLDADCDGNIYAIYSEEDCTSVRMYNSSWEYLRSVRSKRMSALSAVYCDGDDIYAAGVSRVGEVIIERVNLLGYTERSYRICTRDNNAFISKILQYGDFLIALVSDDCGERIYGVDQRSGSINRIKVDGDKVRSMASIDIADGKLLIMTGDKKIILCEFTQRCGESAEERKETAERRGRKPGFRYIVNLIFIKNFARDFFGFFLKYSAPAVLIFSLYSQYGLGRRGFAPGDVRMFREFVPVSFLLTFICVLMKNVTMIWRKRSMVDNMLDIYNRIDTVRRTALFNSIFAGVSLCIPVFVLLRRRGAPHAVALPSIIMSLLLPIAIIYPSYLKGIRRFKRDVKNMVFELLSFNGYNDDLDSVISTDIKKLRKQGVEKYRIKIRTGIKAGRDAIKIIDRWSYLRKKITGDRGKLRKSGDYLVFDLNLKNRDIKYSRVSLIRDFICYINKVINIKSIAIETADDNNATKSV